MARLNIYLPDEFADELLRWRHDLNFSAICTAALRDALVSRTTIRDTPLVLRSTWDDDTGVHNTLQRHYGLRRLLTAADDESKDPRNAVAAASAALLDEVLTDEMQLAIAGGTQCWSTVAKLKPRRLHLVISAVGFGHVDPAAPHVHPNALATLLSLIYAPRSSASLVGAAGFRASWDPNEPDTNHDFRRVIFASCAPFDPSSPYAAILGKEISDYLVEERAIGEFLGIFFTPDGRLLEPYLPSATVSHLGATTLFQLAGRKDTLVVLAAAGKAKVPIIRQALKNKLCNMLVSNTETVRML